MPVRVTVVFLCMALAGCTSYAPLPPLASAPPPVDLASVRVDAATLPFAPLAAHRFDPSDGLDIIEVAMLAVANNPELRLARGDASVAHAQAFAAGLLPDPQLAGSRDLSDSGGGGLVAAYSLGLSYDVNALLQHASARDAGLADAHKADLNLLWQEWQVVSQAQLLFVKLQQSVRIIALLDENAQLFAERVRRTETALARGLVTSDSVAPQLTALQDVQRQRFEAVRQAAQNAHELNALLGLAPETRVQLQGSAALAPLNEQGAAAALAALSQRRPDLQALQAGVAAQDARYRGALLAQFPALNVGLTRARDSSGILSNGIGVSLSLPFLNRNRGNVAIETATRQKLFDEYQVRLQGARDDVARILAEQALNLHMLAEIDTSVAALQAVLAHSEQAYSVRDIDALLYANTRAALLARQLDHLALEQAIFEQRVALRTVLGVESSSFAQPSGVSQ